jgi:glycosyltransferase involved in cell wall biosynthesis
MRVLFLTNFYPPASLGGYEQWCQEVAERLQARHQIVVLTSRHGRDACAASEPDWVRRDLHLEMDLGTMRNGVQFFTRRRAREQENLTHLGRVVRDVAPDVVLVWGMWNLHRTLVAHAEHLMPGRLAYYVGDYWPTLPSQLAQYWDAPARHWSSAWPKRLLAAAARRVLARQAPPTLAFEHALFPTRFMRDEYRRLGIVPTSARIVHGGADTRLYGAEPERPRRGIRSLLYVGRLTRDKGVHIAIEAIGLLSQQDRFSHVHLSIAGTGEDEAGLRRLVQDHHLEARVVFLGHQSREALRTLYHEADVLVFPSLWQEPFGRVLIEAMAAGLVVVGTATGGAAEILTHDENALVFPASDAAALASQVSRLADSEPLRARLASAGRQQALERFSVDRMSAEIETYLCELAAQAPPTPSQRL